jgi:hypothetical protein
VSKYIISLHSFEFIVFMYVKMADRYWFRGVLRRNFKKMEDIDFWNENIKMTDGLRDSCIFLRFNRPSVGSVQSMLEVCMTDPITSVVYFTRYYLRLIFAITTTGSEAATLYGICDYCSA